MDVPLSPTDQFIALIGCDEQVTEVFTSAKLGNRKVRSFLHAIDLFNNWEKGGGTLVAIVSQSEVLGPAGIALLETLRNKKHIQVPFFLVSQQLSESTAKLALKSGISDVFKLPLKKENIEIRLNLIIDKWKELKSPNDQVVDFHKYKTPLIKRIFDIFRSEERRVGKEC